MLLVRLPDINFRWLERSTTCSGRTVMATRKHRNPTGLSFVWKTKPSIYDSKNSKGDNSKIAESIIIAACQILKTPGQYVRIGHVPCDWQHDGFNCGIFAIANATCLGLGVDPSDLQFDVSKMRNHLLDCLRKKEMSAFPLIERRTGRPAAKKVVSEPKQVEVFCTCRCPEYYKSKPGEVSLVECDGEDCKTRWFHPTCEGITEKELKNISYSTTIGFVHVAPLMATSS